jgi:hypothetical protein
MFLDGNLSRSAVYCGPGGGCLVTRVDWLNKMSVLREAGVGDSERTRGDGGRVVQVELGRVDAAGVDGGWLLGWGYRLAVVLRRLNV